MMSRLIQILPEAIANQIAAGEVVQRPASAVKELLENALDAGATEIKLNIKDAGKTLIQIIDNGQGMSSEDATACFGRHATSKIRKIEDLFSINTMGFRGEALASIAAIAQVELKSKRKDDELGTEIHIAGSKINMNDACACQAGTIISVKNLFFNVPARRNFLKSNPVETKHILDEFQRIAIAHPEIQLELIHNGVQIYYLIKGNLRQRLVQLFGKPYNERLIPLEETTDIVQIKGFIGKPEFAKKTRGEQFFFVNDRFIKSPYLNHAVMQAYEQILPKGQYPFYCISLKIDPNKIDINVHPTKQEIKFEDDKLLYTILSAVIKSSIGKFNITPSLDFEGSNTLDHFLAEPTSNIKPSPSFITRSSKMDSHSSFKKDVEGWEGLLDITQEKVDLEIHQDGSTSYSLSPDWGDNTLSSNERSWIQIHNSYIISSIKSGFILVNQELAHERVKFEYYQNLINNQKPNVQQLLFPLDVQCPIADLPLMNELGTHFEALGFDIEHEGDQNFVVRGVPSDLMGKDDPRILEELLEQYKNNQSQLQLEKRDHLALALAKYACIKLGKRLSEEEMQALIDQLFACNQANYSPEGKAIFISISLEDIHKLFEA